MAETNEYGVPVHPWSWRPSLAGHVLIFVPAFVAAIEVAAWHSPWVLGAITVGLGSSVLAWVLDRESSRQTKVVRAHLGMRWGETLRDWRVHRTDALWSLPITFSVWLSSHAGAPRGLAVLVTAVNASVILSHGVSAVQGWRRERAGLPAPECPHLAPVPLTSEPSVS